MLYVSGQETMGDKPKRVPSGRSARGPMRAVVVVAVLLASGLVPLSAGPPSGATRAAVGKQPDPNLSQLPLAFEANHGQLDESVRYVARGQGFDLFLTANEAVFVHDAPADAGGEGLPALLESRSDQANLASADHVVLHMQFGNADTILEPTGADALPGTVNYLLGNDPAAWRTGVPTFREVRYANVWDGIDLVFHGRRQLLEYDFAVQPGADFQQIEIVLLGADTIGLDVEGNLVVTMHGQRQVHRAPRILQERDGVVRELSGRFVLHGDNRFGFAVDHRDPALPLLIDPEVVYATPFFGGSNTDNVFSLAAGDDDRVTIAGYTQSVDFPGMTPSSYQPENPAAAPFRGAGIVARLSRDGTHLEWATYLGGSGDDNKIWKVKVDEAGFAYVCGATNSTDFPTTPNAYDRTYAGGGLDAYLAVLTPNGSNLTYSSLFGGTGGEFFFGCALLADPRGGGHGRGRTLIAATGYSGSPEFPLVNAADATWAGGDDAVVLVVDPTGGGIVYSSWLPGGADIEVGEDIEAFGDTLAIAGWTGSGSRPVLLAWHHATEDGRGVAQMLGSEPFWAVPPGYGNYWNQLLTKAFDLPAGQVMATFAARWETEESFDFLRFRVSTDDGASWTVLGEFDGFSNGFEEVTVDLSPYAGRRVLLQFQFTADFSVSDEDGGIDTNGSAVDWVAVTGHASDQFETSLDGWLPEDGFVPFPPTDFQYGPLGGTDAFVALVKPFHPSPASLRVAAIGGEYFDNSLNVAFAPDGTVVAVGQSVSPSFPVTPDAYQHQPRGTDLWVATWSPDLSALQHATFLGGSNFEFPNGLVVDLQGRPILTGISASTDFPLVDPLDLAPLLGTGGGRDYIFAILSADLSELVHGSKFGDAGWELGGEVDLGPDGSIYFVGRKRAGGAESGATTDVFVIKLAP